MREQLKVPKLDQQVQVKETDDSIRLIELSDTVVSYDKEKSLNTMKKRTWDRETEEKTTEERR